MSYELYRAKTDALLFVLLQRTPKSTFERSTKQELFFNLQNFRAWWRLGPDERGREATARLWLSLSGFMRLLGIGMREPRFLGMPATSGMGFIGPVGSSRVH